MGGGGVNGGGGWGAAAAEEGVVACVYCIPYGECLGRQGWNSQGKMQISVLASAWPSWWGVGRGGRE